MCDRLYIYNISINNVYKTLPEYHQAIIKKTISRIGQGMGEYSLRDLTCGTESKLDFENFNLKIKFYSMFSCMILLILDSVILQ